MSQAASDSPEQAPAEGWRLTCDPTHADGPCPACCLALVFQLQGHTVPQQINTLLTVLANVLHAAQPPAAADEAVAALSEFVRLTLGDLRRIAARRATHDGIGVPQGNA